MTLLEKKYHLIEEIMEINDESTLNQLTQIVQQKTAETEEVIRAISLTTEEFRAEIHAEIEKYPWKNK